MHTLPPNCYLHIFCLQKFSQSLHKAQHAFLTARLNDEVGDSGLRRQQTGLGVHSLAANTLQTIEEDQPILTSHRRVRALRRENVQSIQTQAQVQAQAANPDFTMSTVVARRLSSTMDYFRIQPHEKRILFLFKPGNSIRKFFTKLDQSKIFKNMVHICIITSCFLLILTPPAKGYHDSELFPEEDIKFWNRIFTLVFTVEFVVKVMSEVCVLVSSCCA